MNEQNNTDVVRQAYDAFQHGDIERLLNYCAPDIDWRLPQVPNIPFTGERHGREQVRDFFRQLAQLQDIEDFRPLEYIAQRDKVAVMGQYTWGVKGSGQHFRSDWMHVFTVKDGQIQQFLEYSDTHQAALAYQPPLGAAKQPSTRPSVH